MLSYLSTYYNFPLTSSILPYLTLAYYLTFLYLALPYRTISYRALPYLTSWYGFLRCLDMFRSSCWKIIRRIRRNCSEWWSCSRRSTAPAKSAPKVEGRSVVHWQSGALPTNRCNVFGSNLGSNLSWYRESLYFSLNFSSDLSAR